MRSQDEIEVAFEIVEAALKGKLKLPLPPDELETLQVRVNALKLVLGWVLENPKFEDLTDTLNSLLQYVRIDISLKEQNAQNN